MFARLTKSNKTQVPPLMNIPQAMEGTPFVRERKQLDRFAILFLVSLPDGDKMLTERLIHDEDRRKRLDLTERLFFRLKGQKALLSDLILCKNGTSDLVVLEDIITCHLQQPVSQQSQQGRLLREVRRVDEIVDIIVAKGILLPEEELIQWG